MRNRSRPFAGLSKTIFAAFAALGLIGAAAPGGVTVTVKVTDLRDMKGTIRGCITSDAKEFPDCRKDGPSQQLVIPAKGDDVLRFTGVKPGTYAIALLHDENDNGKMDKKLLFMPKEGYGFSRDAPVRMAPPKFEAARFDVAGAPISLTIKMRYM